jgi:hypothetical protein
MPAMNSKDYRSLPEVSPPPFYDDKTRYTDDHGTSLPKRRMGERGGLPQGAKKYGHGDKSSADSWFEWDPGEFQRSYPKSDSRNAAWYKMHRYGRLPGKDYDGWTRRVGPPSPTPKAGPPSPVKAAAKAAASKKVGSSRPSPARGKPPLERTATKGATAVNQAAKAAKKAVGKLF